jgi:predicted nucleotidyltransferase
VALSRKNRLVSGEGEPEVVSRLRGALERNDAVASVVLGGSRARGTATALSDWDLYLEGDTQEMMAEIPALVASLEPLAAFWEPLSENAGYMIVMRGPVKVDLFPIGGRRELQPPWVPSTETIGAIDAHFWDWTLWLGGKSLRDERQLVADELAKMQWFLLGPLGVARRQRASMTRSSRTAGPGIARRRPSGPTSIPSLDNRSRMRSVDTALSPPPEGRSRRPSPSLMRCGRSRARCRRGRRW